MDKKEDIETLLINLLTANLELADILKDLLKKLVLEHKNRSVSKTDPDDALSEILNKATTSELRCLKSLKQEMNINKFYDTSNVPYTFKDSIRIDGLDVTCIVEILRNLEGFPINRKSMKPKNCAKKGSGHVKCCAGCKHTCTFCGQTSCSPKSCDAADVDHKCWDTDCKEKKTVCNKNSTVCCSTCGLCRKCGTMLQRGQQCQVLKLCIGVEIIYYLRNMFGHISPVDCASFLSSGDSLPNFPDCGTLSELTKKLRIAGEDILIFMSNPHNFTKTNPISEENKMERSHHLRLNLEEKKAQMEKYGDKIVESISSLLESEITKGLEHFFTELNEKLKSTVEEIVEQKMQQMKDEKDQNKTSKRKIALAEASETLRQYYKDQHSKLPKLHSIQRKETPEFPRDDIIVEVSLSEIRQKSDRQHDNDGDDDVSVHCIFNDKNNKYAVISGAPGVGKSTLIDTLLLQWAENQIWNGTDGMPNFQFVFVLPCRNVNKLASKKVVTLEDLLKDQYREVFKKIKMDDLDANNLLIIEGFEEFSGYDEFKKLTDDRKNSPSGLCQCYYDMLHPKSSTTPFYRLVTCRPTAHFEILTKFEHSPRIRNLVITGFSDANKQLFIGKYFGDNTEKANITRQKLEESPQLSSLATRPFFCCVYCTLVDDSNVLNFPETYSSIYASIVLLYLQKHGKKYTSDLRRFVESDGVKSTIFHISEIAYQTLKARNIQFRKEDIQIPDIDLHEVIDSSGLIESLNEEGKFEDEYFQFTHQIFHEFMAALHVFYHRLPVVWSDRDDKFLFSKSSILLFLSGFIGYINVNLEQRAPLEQAIGLLAKLRGKLKNDLGHPDEFCRLMSDAEEFINERSELYYGMIFEYKKELEQIPTTKSLVLPPPDHTLSSYDVICIESMFEKIQTTNKRKLPFKHLSIDVQRLSTDMFKLFCPFLRHLQSLCLLSYDEQYIEILSKQIPSIKSVELPHCGVPKEHWETISKQINTRYMANTLKLKRLCVRDKMEQILGYYLWYAEHPQCIAMCIYENVITQVEEVVIEVDKRRLDSLCKSILQARKERQLQLKVLDLKIRDLEIFKKFSECFHHFRSLKKIQVLLSTLCKHKVEERRRSKSGKYKQKLIMSHGRFDCLELTKDIIVCKNCRREVEKAVDKIIAVPKKGKPFEFNISIVRNEIVNGQAEFYWELVFTPV